MAETVVKTGNHAGQREVIIPGTVVGRRARAHARAPASYHGRSAHAPTGAKSRGPQSPITPTAHAPCARGMAVAESDRRSDDGVNRAARREVRACASAAGHTGFVASLDRSPCPGQESRMGRVSSGWVCTYVFICTHVAGVRLHDTASQVPQLLGESSKQYAAVPIRLKANDPSSINA